MVPGVLFSVIRRMEVSFTAVWSIEGADELGGWGAKGDCFVARGGQKESAFRLGQAGMEPSERSCAVNGWTSDAQKRFQIETVI